MPTPLHSARLLINADDFGLHADINRGILDCVDKNCVQSVSFSPLGRAVDWQKLQELMRHGVRIGMHVTLVGEPWTTDGRTLNNWKDLALQLLLRGRMMEDAVGQEIRRQFQICSENGIDPCKLSHVDSHQHVHVFGGVWQICEDFVREYSIPRIRIPWCPSLRVIKKNPGGIALQMISRRRAAATQDFLSCLGLAHAGRNTVATLSQELGEAAAVGHPGVELVVHPGINTPNLETQYGAWHFDWTRERDALLSAQFAEAVSASGYTLFDAGTPA